ncbi:MAG: CotH kinase family protein [Planctomycetes bacterium]|nr:CotH kinase family protein [Planctomycetota bacterium]
MRPSSFLAPFALLLALAAPAFAQHPLPRADKDWDDAGEAILLRGEVGEIQVSMDEADLDAFIADPYTDVYASCTVRIVNSVVDETYLDVGIRPRGNSQRGSNKFPWKLSFNEFVSGRKVHGLEKVNLAGEATDPSQSRETLAYDLFRSMGVAATRTSHYWVTINDGTKVRALYNLIQPVDEEFVQAWFGNKDGDLYKCRWKDEGAKLLWKAPGDASTYEAMSDYEVKITGSYQRLAYFIDFINNTDDVTFAAGIDDWLNVDSFLRAQACDLYLGGWDGIWILPNNYYLYWDTETQRFEYMPWDLDHTFGMDYWVFPYFFGTDWARRGYNNWGRGGPASEPGNGNGPPIVDRLLKIPAYDQKLQEYVRQIAREQGHPEFMMPQIDQLEAMLAPYAFQGTFSGSSADNNYKPKDFADSWEKPGNYSAFSIPATWGVRPFLRERSSYVRDRYPVPNPLPPVFLNEAVSDNESVYFDEAGEADDFVELFNRSTQPIDLADFTLSDRYGAPQKWAFPAGAVIPPRSTLVVWCDGEVAQGPLHTNFRLSNEGEGIYLFSVASGFPVLVDSLLLPELGKDQSFARFPDGGEQALVSDQPTPEDGNAAPRFTVLQTGYAPDEILIDAVGATPQGKVAFVYSLNTGNWTVTGGTPCDGLGLGLAPPVVLASYEIADAFGNAQVVVPEEILPGPIYVQVIEGARCEASAVFQLGR